MAASSGPPIQAAVLDRPERLTRERNRRRECRARFDDELGGFELRTGQWSTRVAWPSLAVGAAACPMDRRSSEPHHYLSRNQLSNSVLSHIEQHPGHCRPLFFVDLHHRLRRGTRDDRRRPRSFGRLGHGPRWDDLRADFERGLRPMVCAHQRRSRRNRGGPGERLDGHSHRAQPLHRHPCDSV
jgi:hypothetical protein